MKSKTKKKTPEIILREGKTVVVLDIDEYQEMLERMEDTEDLRMLEKIRSKFLKFRSLDDFMNGCHSRANGNPGML